ncbi:MAG TPA: hypothetical protein VHX18_00255, partial [Rhizomicrobium sp.]|nr:hypothetical protein [Rhizomicrobium sp.]
FSSDGFNDRKKLPQLSPDFYQFAGCENALAAGQSKTCVKHRIGMPKQGDKVRAARAVGPRKPVFFIVLSSAPVHRITIFIA